MPMEIGNSFDPLRFYSCFKSVSKDSHFRVDVLNTSNSCHKIFINKNEIKNEKSKKEIKNFSYHVGLQPLPDSHHILLELTD